MWQRQLRQNALLSIAQITPDRRNTKLLPKNSKHEYSYQRLYEICFMMLAQSHQLLWESRALSCVRVCGHVVLWKYLLWSFFFLWLGCKQFNIWPWKSWAWWVLCVWLIRYFYFIKASLTFYFDATLENPDGFNGCSTGMFNAKWRL